VMDDGDIFEHVILSLRRHPMTSGINSLGEPTIPFSAALTVLTVQYCG
jgi:hypothetical protein